MDILLMIIAFLELRKIQHYPNGNGCQRDQSISNFLVSVDATGFDCRKSVQAKYPISIKDQINGSHRETIGSNRTME
ncbi:hypothetical protein K7X08_023807 [Anisodus acutangulus]|uniref:Uncharacterized protein n=1 Tax=Anisodus acutangulus TaxID=402998 RepID=A0A9Q1L8T4_9SOLA|nr:hypothetical protein K7X08_023807 [Anisodus acutangulus]